MSNSLLEVTLRHRMGALDLNLCFKLTAPWTVLFGASGSGKTTILRTIAGFVRPHSGLVVLRGTPLVDTGHRVFLPAHRRGVRSAGQVARLFQGMTVKQNLQYGASAQVLDEVVQLFQLSQILEKRPEALSGGERQRVSVARAVASAASGGVSLLLLDEPFGGLDFALRDALAVGLRDWLRVRKVPVLSVTHDVGETFLLEAEVIRLTDGKLMTQGAAAVVLAEERERLVRQLGGT